MAPGARIPGAPSPRYVYTTVDVGYFPQRGKTKSYSNFDRKTWIARLGMAQESTADEEMGVLADGLPDSLDVAVELQGRLQKVDANRPARHSCGLWSTARWRESTCMIRTGPV